MQLANNQRSLQLSIYPFLLVFALGIASKAQTIELTKGEFDSAVARFQTSTNGVSHRETTNSEELSNGKVVKTIEIIREWDAEGNRHVITKASERGSSSVTESTWIGMVEYRRDGSGGWTKTDRSKGPFTGGDIVSSQDEKRYSFQERNEGSIPTRIYTSEIVYNRDSGKRIEVIKTFTNQFNWRLKAGNRRELKCAREYC